MTSTWSRAAKTAILIVLLLGLVSLLSLAGCTSKEASAGTTGDGTATSVTEAAEASSGDVAGSVGETLKVGSAQVTVNALQATFQPVLPAQRLSERVPSSPVAGEAFYQAYVRVQNLGVAPIRVDPADFTCLIGNSLLSIDVTRSGPPARSLLKNASLDLILTFKAQAGQVPELRYDPPWYDGSIRVTTASEEEESGAQDGAENGEETSTTK